MSKKEKEPSEVLAGFLEYINGCREQYQAAHEAVKTEERRLQDLLHELELAEAACQAADEAGGIPGRGAAL